MLERNDARNRILQRQARRTVEEYATKRRADRVCRKKHDFKKRKVEKIKEACHRGNTRTLYQRVKEERKGSDFRTVFCKYKDENLLGNKYE